MTYFPPRSTVTAKPSKCPGCARWFVPTPGMENVSCTVYHGPGSCCHYSETLVNKAGEVIAPDPGSLSGSISLPSGASVSISFVTFRHGGAA